MTKKRYIIYGREGCPYCSFAQDFCQAKDLQVMYLDYTKNTDALTDCMKFYKTKTVPIILENDLETGLVKFVGGYTDLLEHLK